MDEILNKIRAEIIDTGAYEQEVNGQTEFLKGINYCLGVIDRYKALDTRATFDRPKDVYAAQIKQHLDLVADAYEDFEITDGTHFVSVKELIKDIGTGIKAAIFTNDHFKSVDKYHECTGLCCDCIGQLVKEKAVKGDYGDCSTCVRDLK